MPLVTGPSSAIEPVQIPDMVGNYARLQQLKQQMQEAPLRQQALEQQVQAQQLDIQDKQRAAEARQALNTAISGATTTDDNGMPTVDPGKLAAGLKNGPAAYQTPEVLKGISDFHESLTKAKSAYADLQTKQNDVLGSAAAAVKAANYDPTIAHSLLDTMPQSPQINAIRAQIDNPAVLKQFVDTAIQNSAKQRELGAAETTAAARQQTAQTEAQKAANAAAYGPTGMAADGKYTFLQSRLAQNQPISADDQAWMKGYEKQKTLVPTARFELTQGARAGAATPGYTGNTGDDFLATLPAGMQAQVKAMANGDITIPPAGSRNPQAQQLRAAVLTYDPTYTDARYKGKQNFKTSGDAQNIVQLSTAMEHADHAIANSANIGFAPMLGNPKFEAPGSAAYMQDAEFLTGEVGKLVKNGVLTQDESNKISSGLTSSRQGVRDAALKETMDLLGGKVGGVFQKYKTATGQDLPVNEFFDAKSQQRLQKYGFTSQAAGQGSTGNSGGAATAPPAGMQQLTSGGKTYHIPAAQVAEFKKDHPDAR